MSRHSCGLLGYLCCEESIWQTCVKFPVSGENDGSSKLNNLDSSYHNLAAFFPFKSYPFRPAKFSPYAMFSLWINCSESSKCCAHLCASYASLYDHCRGGALCLWRYLLCATRQSSWNWRRPVKNNELLSKQYVVADQGSDYILVITFLWCFTVT
jgi:hypothetical protein